MKVLLTGGTGFVGSRLRGALKAAGHDVRLLVRAESEHPVSATEGFDIVTGDVFNTNSCLKACAGMDAVVNLIGIIREYRDHGIMFDEYHRQSVENILQACRIEKVDRLIHMSALGVRADAKSKYHQTKWAGEQLIRQSDMRWTIFRPSWIFGPGDGLSEQINDLLEASVVPLIDGGKYRIQPIAVDDVVTCMARSLGMPETQGESYDMGGPDRLQFVEVVHKFAQIAGKKVRTMNVPSWSIKPVVALMERFAFFPLTIDQLRMLSEDNVCEIDHFVKAFHIEPKSFNGEVKTLVRHVARAA